MSALPRCQVSVILKPAWEVFPSSGVPFNFWANAQTVLPTPACDLFPP